MEDLSPKKTAKNQYRTWRRWLDARRWDFSTISGTRAVRICCTIVSMLQSDRILRSVRFWDWDFLITCKHMTDGLDKDLSPSCPKGRPPVRQWNIRIPTAQTSVRASTWAERKHCERKGCTSLNTVSQNAKQQMMNKLMAKNLRALVCLLRREVHWRVDSAYQRLIVQLLQWKGSQRKQFECMDERVWKLGTIS